MSPADLRRAGFALCRPDPGRKKPSYPGWPTRSLEPTDFGRNDLIGILGGPLSDGGLAGHALVVIDNDCPEAVEKAEDFLPPTPMMDGRPGKRNDHRYYLTPVASIPEWAFSQAKQAAFAARAATGHPGPCKRAFNHCETKARLLDFIGTGGQLVCPSRGNERTWSGGMLSPPAVVPFAELWDATCQLALACGWRASEHTSQHTPRPDLLTRVLRYLDTIPGAVSGQDGHGGTYWPARVVCWGFNLGADEGFRVLWTYFNPRCNPPWAEAELRHKCRDADSLPFGKPRGWLLHAPGAPASPDPIPATTEQQMLAMLDLLQHKPYLARVLWRLLRAAEKGNHDV